MYQPVERYWDIMALLLNIVRFDFFLDPTQSDWFLLM